MNIKKYKTELYFLGTYVILCMYVFMSTPPKEFPVNSVFTITPGSSLTQVTRQLHDKKIIRSQVLFQSAVIVLGGEKRVIAGDYLFDTRDTSPHIAYRFLHGLFELNPIKITIPEGWNTFQIARYIKKQIPTFDVDAFLKITKEKKLEGYLFPNTYFFSPHVTPEGVAQQMSSMFTASLLTVPEINTFRASKNDIITMASLVEAEAQTTADRRIVAGILWKRLSEGMPLQVDSTFMYINGKNTYELTASDLKINSPYNTYIYRGLPPTPINNPGIDSIRATVTPVDTENLFFFSSRDGTMYYAKTYEQHKKNISRYGGN